MEKFACLHNSDQLGNLSIGTDCGWNLLAEGGVHVVFCNFRCRCCVVKASKFVDNDGDPSSHLFRSQVMDIWFEKEVIALRSKDWSATSIVRQNLVEVWRSCPTSRFTLENENIEDLSQLSIIENAFCRSSGSLSIGFEVKVKGMFVSCSPFVGQGANSLKLTQLRFATMQAYKRVKSKKPFIESSYSPSMISSGSKPDVQAAVRALFCNPQNNLRVVCDGKVLPVPKFRENDAFLDQWSIAGRFSALDFVELVSATLHSQHALLLRLQQIQVLDVLDSEGAEFVYRQLCGISSFSNGILLSYFAEPLSISEFQQLSSIVLDFHHNKEITIPDVCSLSPGIVSFLRTLICDTQSTEEKKSRRQEAERVICECCTEEDLLFLLKAWMMSTIGCDLSIAIALSSSHYDDWDRQVERLVRPSVCVIPTGTGSGKMRFEMDDGSRQEMGFSVSLLDLEMKSISKLWTKATKDFAIYSKVANSCL